VRTAIVLLASLSAGLLAVAPAPAGSTSPAGRQFGVTTLDGNMKVLAIQAPADTVELGETVMPTVLIYYDGEDLVERVGPVVNSEVSRSGREVIVDSGVKRTAL